MQGEPDISVPARALGDATRGLMVSALLGGRQIPAGELARVSGVSASTASEHLQVLLGAGLVGIERRGRNRFYRLADDDVARAVEALQAVAPRREIRSLSQSEVSKDLQSGRTCYDHLAGELGIRITRLLVDAAVIPELAVAVAGPAPDPFPRGAVVDALRLKPAAGRRPWVRGCLDWSDRRPHAAGQVGAQVLDAFLTEGWVTRRSSSRAVRLTASGERVLRALELPVTR